MKNIVCKKTSIVIILLSLALNASACSLSACDWESGAVGAALQNQSIVICYASLSAVPISIMNRLMSAHKAHAPLPGGSHQGKGRKNHPRTADLGFARDNANKQSFKNILDISPSYISRLLEQRLERYAPFKVLTPFPRGAVPILLMLFILLPRSRIEDDVLTVLHSFSSARSRLGGTGLLFFHTEYVHETN